MAGILISDREPGQSLLWTSLDRGAPLVRDPPAAGAQAAA